MTDYLPTLLNLGLSVFLITLVLRLVFLCGSGCR